MAAEHTESNDGAIIIPDQRSVRNILVTYYATHLETYLFGEKRQIRVCWVASAAIKQVKVIVIVNCYRNCYCIKSYLWP